MNAALASWTSSNGLANTLSCDADGRLTGINTLGVESLGYSYDTANRLTGIDNALNEALSQNFDYGDQSRVVSMISATMTASYSYDENGNRTTSVQGGASNSTGYSTTSNRLVSTTGTNPLSYGYDALGNVTTLNGTTAYQYDAFNRMSAAGGMTYYVNPEGQRLRKSGSLGTTYFAPDANGPLMAENDSGAWIDYLWLDGRLIGREVNGQLEVIGDDQVGRPQVVTNAAQTVVWNAQNRPFTSDVAVSNSAPLNLGFPGQYYDAETGLWNNGFRDYDSVSGRYVEGDPLGLNSGQWNTYAYVAGNPLTNIDPYGLWSLSFQAYDVFGGGFSISGKGFSFTSIGFRVGVGVGAGFSFNPKGGAPDPSAQAKCGSSNSIGLFGEASVGVGPFSAGVGGNVDGTEQIDNNSWNGYGGSEPSLTAGNGTDGWPIKFGSKGIEGEAEASAGLEITHNFSH